METQGEETPAKSRIQWAQITISALITALLALAVGLLVVYFTSKEPILTYEIFPVSSFSGETRELIIQNIRIQNEGDEEAEKVQVVVSFPASAKISDANFEASSLALEVNPVPDTSEFKRAYEIPMLNQNEYISFSFLVENYSGQGVDVAVRGTGVSGVLKEVSNGARTPTLMTVIIISVLGVLFGVLGVTAGSVYSRLAYVRMDERRETFRRLVGVQKEAQAQLEKLHREQTEALILSLKRSQEESQAQLRKPRQ